MSIHWGNGAHLQSAGGERFDTHFMLHAVGHPVEQMIALRQHVCEESSKTPVPVWVPEAGCGWAARVERLDEHFEPLAEMPKMTKEPSEHFADGNLFLSAEPDERLVPVAGQLGHDCPLPSDYPHTDSKPRTRQVRERARRPPDGPLPVAR